MGYSDFTHHKNEERKKRYIERHQHNENWNDPMTPGSLSRFILWGNATNLNQAIKDYEKKFNV